MSKRIQDEEMQDKAMHDVKTIADEAVAANNATLDDSSVKHDDIIENIKDNESVSDTSLIEKEVQAELDSDTDVDPDADSDSHAETDADTDTNHTPKPKKGRIFLRIFLGLFFVIALGLGYVAWDIHTFLTSPVDSTASETTFDVEKGATFKAVAHQLEEAGLISNAERFVLLGRFYEATAKMQAGRFAVSAAMSPQDILDVLLYGKPVLYRVTIQEGLPWWKIGKILEQEGFTTYRDFQAVVHDPAFLRRFGIPFESAEGFLFPDTYLLRKPRKLDRDAAEAVASRLVNAFWERNTAIFPQGMSSPVETIKTLVTLASIVEKETSKAEERATVAGVYTNRLRIPMRLQADPTVIYGLGPSFNGNITRSNLRDESNPYNTYRHDGLPPGPICSMGSEALAAAANPEKHRFLYFVAKGGGLHEFTINYEDHKKAVQRYIRKK